jgi:hypothetical protein
MLASACPAVPTAAPMVGAAGHYFNAAAGLCRPTYELRRRRTAEAVDDP